MWPKLVVELGAQPSLPMPLAVGYTLVPLGARMVFSGGIGALERAGGADYMKGVGVGLRSNLLALSRGPITHATS